MQQYTQNRSVLHLDLDSFFVSVERLKNPGLIGIPLIIGSAKPRGVVACCSYEARMYGVHAGMAGAQAKRLCPSATFISGNYASYSYYSDLVTSILQDHAPALEKASVDEFYVELTGLDKFYGCYKWATEIRKRIIKETGLPISFGLASNKLVAKIATGQAKPNGELYIKPGEEQAFLDPLPISKIPMLGDKTAQILYAKGIKKIEVLRQMPLPLLQSMLGKTGNDLYLKAHGIDNRAIEPFYDPKSVSAEETYEKDITNTVSARNQIAYLTEKIAHRLRGEKKVAGCITVKVRSTNYQTFTRQAHFSYTNSDAVLIKQALHQFERLYDKKSAIRLLGVKLSDLTAAGTQQLRLFEQPNQSENLYKAIDNLKDKFGGTAVLRAISISDLESSKSYNKAV